MLSQKALQQFKELWKEEYGEEISDAFAMEMAAPLLAAVDAIYRPIKIEWLDELQQKELCKKA